MSGKTYVGNASGVAKVPKKIYAGNSSNVAKAVKVVYCGNSSGKAVEVWRNSTLPSTYQKVEYIFNTGGTQWIETGVKPNSDTTLRIEAMRTQNNNYHMYIFGIRELIDSTWYYYGLQLLSNGSTVRILYHASYTAEYVEIANAYALNQKVTVDFAKSGGNFYINGALKYTSQKTFSAYSIPLPLFGYKSGSSNVEPQPEGLRVYRFQAWQSNVLIRDMYPCYLKSNTQTVGMYDLVNGQFYGNSGTGIFYKGPNID